MIIQQISVGDCVVVKESIIPFLEYKHKIRKNYYKVTKIDTQYKELFVDGIGNSIKITEIDCVIDYEDNPEYFL